MRSNLAKLMKEKKWRKAGKVSQNDLRVLEQFHSAAYGSNDNLLKATNVSREKSKTYQGKSKVIFAETKNAHTKYRQVPRNFLRLRENAYHVNEIWSLDVAYVDKLAKYNNGVKSLLVAKDVSSRYLRVPPMRSKSAEETAGTFRKMIEKQDTKVWTDKGAEYKILCGQEGIATYTTQSESKSAPR